MIPVAVFTGGIKPLPASGRPTGMFKTRVPGPIALTEEGFVGDQQADRRVHGGPDKAVHLYPARHYASLASSFPEIAAALVPGALGENLSAADIDERDVRIGDIWKLGSALLQVCQPRTPCWKIDERFSCEGVAAAIAKSHITGWYLRVKQPGTVSPADAFELFQAASGAPTLHEAMLLWAQHRPEIAELEALARLPGMADGWRDKINQRLAWLKGL
jgi:MOSC domain-containing protein YiiM